MKNTHTATSPITRHSVAQASFACGVFRILHQARPRSFSNLTGGTPVLQNPFASLEGDAPSAPKLQARSGVSWAFAFFFLATSLFGIGNSLAQTFFSLSSGDYAQNFSDITNWTNNYAAGTGANNWRVAGNATGSTGLSNTAVFTTATSGGVQKGTEALVFLATGTNSGATDLLMDFSGRIAGNLSFSYAKVANSASATPRTSDLKIQFSTNNGTSFTDLTPFPTPRISNNSTAESGSINVALPDALNGQSQVVLRFFFWNNGQTGGSGNRPKWSIDDVAVTSSPASATAPTITSFNPTSGAVGNSVTITGTNFAAGATVSFNGTSSTNVTFTNNTSLTATVPAGATSGPITVTVGAESGVSSTSFTVVNPSAPAISTNGTFTAFSTTSGNASAAQTLGVTGTNLTASITATAPTGFEVSTDGTSFASNATITQSSGSASATLSVRIASSASVGALTGNLTLASTGATSVSIPLSGTVNAPAAGAISITPGATISENFSSLGNSSIATLPSGWKVDKNTTERTLGTYASAVTATERAGGANLSTSAGNGIYNFGSSPTDRAVGGLSSGSASKSVNLYAALQNTGGSSISSFTISYNAERYRNGSNTAGFAIQLYYSTNGTVWTSAGSDFLSAFAANADNNGAATVPIETLAVTAASLPVSLDPGATLYLAWNYSVATGTTTSNAQALGVSDIQITAAGGSTPAPAITSATSANATVGTAFSYTITASNSPASFGATGLPAGLTVNTTTGVISGTPTTAGNSNATISATNLGGTGNATLSFTIAQGTPVITTPPTASAITAGQALSASTLTGGLASVAGSFAFADPSFIPGATGSQIVVFTPTDAANYTTANTSVTVTVNPAPSSPFDTWAGGNVTMTPAVLSLYAIGGGSYNGTVAPEAPVLSTTGGNLSLTAIVRTNDPALTVSGQSLTDLVLGTWSSSEVTSTTEGLDQTGLAAQGLERRRYSVPTTGTKKFLRLRAVYAGDN